MDSLLDVRPGIVVRYVIGEPSTGLAAQRRFEWRQTTRYLPLAVLFSFVAVAYSSFVYGRNAIGLIYLSVAGSAIPAAFGVGHYLIYASPRYRAFVYTKPLGNTELARAKIHAGLAAWLVSAAIFGVTVATFIGLLSRMRRYWLGMGIAMIACGLVMPGATDRQVGLAMALMFIVGAPVSTAIAAWQLRAEESDHATD